MRVLNKRNETRVTAGLMFHVHQTSLWDRSSTFLDLSLACGNSAALAAHSDITDALKSESTETMWVALFNNEENKYEHAIPPNRVVN